ncbi:MAG: glycogen synthase, partial [Sediminibacterium sp.]|nr:glycogen synthase [Sediminibacterium sp.]
GIDNEVWNPATDMYLSHHYTSKTVNAGKEKNKALLCSRFGLDIHQPLIVFIGRLVGEKAAELLPDAIAGAIHQMGNAANFLVLGSGEHYVEGRLTDLLMPFSGMYNVVIGYDEALSHLMYAGADFLLMPSRVEPCGLNQLYALRYGTIPIVRATGGLRDTITDMGDPGGFGIRFDQASVADIIYSIGRAISAYQSKEQLTQMRVKMMGIDHSWENTVEQYTRVYLS